MRRAASILLRSLLFLGVLLLGIWGVLALWFKLPEPDALRWGLAGLFALLTGGALLSALRAGPVWTVAAFLGGLLSIAVWWVSLTPPTDGDWSAEVARQVTGTVDGDTLTLHNARAFRWRTEEDFDAVWETRHYDLTTLETADLFLSYWAGPAMAHFMMSFGFADGQQLSWSVEVRRSQGATFSPLADFFKANPVTIVAGEESDIVGLRSNVQAARVHLFRLRSDPAQRRRLLEGYVALANRLDAEPAFFNSLLTNCSMTVIRLARALGSDLPLDWRLFVNGYLPAYLYDRGVLDTEVPLDALYESGDISDRARAAGMGPDYSAAIRMGVPVP